MSFTRTLRAVSGVVVAGALLFGTAPIVSADEIRDEQWALNDFDAAAVWKVSTGKGVTVAVIDNGVNGSHPDLKGNVLPGKDFTTTNGGPADDETKNKHGTAMASLIAAHGHGVGDADGVKGLAPDAKILPVKYLDADSDTVPVFGSVGSFAAPLRYAVDHGAKVVNMSFGSSQPSPQWQASEKAAIAYAVKHDVLLVAASGNSGADQVGYPGSEPGVVAVGAVSRDLKVWEDSNYGTQVMLTAPGTQIRDAGLESGYQGTKGTSDATAYVSAAAALLRSKFPNLTAGQIVNRLTKTALIPDSAGVTKVPDPHYGYGIIRPYAALTRNIPAGPKNGPLTMPDLSSVSASSGSTTAGGTTASAAPAAANSDDSDTSKTLLSIGGISLCVLVVIGVIVGIVIWSKNNNRRNGPPPGGNSGGGWGGGAYPPQQPGPYQQQAPSPYASQQAPPNQWPNQQ